MNKKISLGLALALLLIVATLAVTLTMVFAMDRFSNTVNEVSKRQAMFDYITEIDKAVRQNYSGTIDETKLREALASSYMQNIGDKYAAYVTADTYAALQQARAARTEGFGLTMTRLPSGAITVALVDVGSPAAAAGVQAGDRLIAINDLQLDVLTGLTAAQEELSTAPNVLLTVQREDRALSFSLLRSEYTIVSVEGRLFDTVGYVRIRTFNEVTPDQFYEVYDALLSQGASSFIFDLRGNRGGSLDAAVEILGYLMPRGTFALRRDAAGNTVALSTDNLAYELDVPSVTLVNASTEGEAELFAGVLQEFAYTTVVGTVTRGRSYVQEYFPISSDNAAIRLSVGELMLRKGGSWEGIGIQPNKEVTSNWEDAASGILNLEQDEAFTEARALLSGTVTTIPTEPTATTTAGTTEPTEPTVVDGENESE